MARTTVNCDTDTKEWFDSLRPEDARTEDDFLRALLEQYDESDATHAAETGVASDELLSELIDEIGATVGGPQVDDSELANEVARQIDYAHLAGQVADELEGRLRR